MLINVHILVLNTTKTANQRLATISTVRTQLDQPVQYFLVATDHFQRRKLRLLNRKMHNSVIDEILYQDNVTSVPRHKTLKNSNMFPKQHIKKRYRIVNIEIKYSFIADYKIIPNLYVKLLIVAIC